MKFKMPSIFSAASFLLDGVAVALAFLAANWIRFRSGWFPVHSVTAYHHFRSFVFLLVCLYWVVFKYFGLYRKRRGISGVDELSKIIKASLVAGFLVGTAVFLTHFTGFSRLVAALMAPGVVLLAWAERLALRRVQVFLRRRGVGVTRVLVVGTGETARVLLQRLRANPGLGYRVVGVVAETGSGRMVEGYKVLGRLEQFSRILRQGRPEEVIFALPASAHAKLIPMLVTLQDTWVRYKIVSDLFGIITNPLASDVLFDMPVFEMKEAPLSAWRCRALKRSFDFALSLLGILLLAIPLGALALGVKLSSPGPVFFRQKRVGRDGKIFHMLKFRSMRPGSETMAFTAKDDPRVTPFGKFIRKTSLDELPQLFNVLRGEMSLVGPRPEVPGLVEKFEKEIPRYFERHQVKSGITGWAQVNGLRGNTSLSERVKYDIYYIENWSLLFDVKIILRTVLDILEHQHA
ncbi:MAG TPA: undecaprenyl-phosphate glucose phosphotransferase, partial [bacterium]|nr:undecaprenyl-phosphate glucose phosphotransferase [bacterium]